MLEVPQDPEPDDLQRLRDIERRMQMALEPFRREYSDILKTMGGKSYGSYLMNRAVADVINRIGHILGIRICDPTTGNPASLRCYLPPRALRGIFQLRCQIEGKQKMVYSDPTIPSDPANPSEVPHVFLEPDTQ